MVQKKQQKTFERRFFHRCANTCPVVAANDHSKGIAGDVKGPVFPVCACAMIYFMLLAMSGWFTVMVPCAHPPPDPCECVGEPDRDEGAHHLEMTAGSQCVTHMLFQLSYDSIDNVTVEGGKTGCPQEHQGMKSRRIEQEPCVVKKDLGNTVEVRKPVMYSTGEQASRLMRKSECRRVDRGWPCQACRRWLCGCYGLCAGQADVEKIRAVRCSVNLKVLKLDLCPALSCAVSELSNDANSVNARGSTSTTWLCCRLIQGLPEKEEQGDQCREGNWVDTETEGEYGECDDIWMMQRGKGKDNKRQRSPTPRRRRIPARGRGRVEVEPSERQYRRASWARAPTRPTCSESWVDVPWRRGARARGRSRQEPEHEGEGEPMVNLTAASSTPSGAPPLPPFEEGVRAWGELIGILDPGNRSFGG